MSDASQSILPPNSTPLERGLSLATERAATLPVRIRDVWSPWRCPAGTLPWLAWSLSIDEWDAAWSEQQKRAAIAASIQVHRVKGTLGALRRALAALGYEVIINENTGTPYTFRLAIDAGGRTLDGPALYAEAVRIANSVKNVRSHLLGVDTLLSATGTFYVGVFPVNGETTTVFPEYQRELIGEPLCLYALCVNWAATTTILPPPAPFYAWDGGVTIAWDGGALMTI